MEKNKNEFTPREPDYTGFLRVSAWKSDDDTIKIKLGSNITLNVYEKKDA